MNEMQGKLNAGVDRAFSAAAKHRDLVAEIKKQRQEDPELLAMRVVNVVPECLKRNRAIGLESLGLDVADIEAVKNFKAGSVGEWQIACRLTTYHQIYSAFLDLVGQFAIDPHLTGVRSAQMVCDAFIEATERDLYTIALDFEELRRSVAGQEYPREMQEVPAGDLSMVLTGIVATRTSLHINVPLRVAIDERREHSAGKSAKQERFQQLLIELPGAVLVAWDETPHNPGGLDDVRTKAVRQLEERTSLEKAAQRVLTEFELRESAAFEELNETDLAQRVGLSERELQVWYLDQWLDEEVGPNTKLKARVISTILGGLDASTVRRYRKRYRKKFDEFKRSSGL